MPYVQRKARQQPWYHAPLPRCETSIMYGNHEQCVNSGRYTDVKTQRHKLCRIHGLMVDFDIMLIPETTIILRGEL